MALAGRRTITLLPAHRLEAAAASDADALHAYPPSISIKPANPAADHRLEGARPPAEVARKETVERERRLTPKRSEIAAAHRMATGFTEPWRKMRQLSRMLVAGSPAIASAAGTPHAARML